MGISCRWNEPIQPQFPSKGIRNRRESNVPPQVCESVETCIALHIPRPHYRKARLKFCNISEVPVEVFFSLSENECFSIEPQMLYIDVRMFDDVFSPLIIELIDRINSRSKAIARH